MATIQTYDHYSGRFVDVVVPDPQGETVSAKSIAAYNAFTGRKPEPSITPSCYPRSRNASTMPPPAPSIYEAEMLDHADELEKAALRILSRVSEIRVSVKRRGGFR